MRLVHGCAAGLAALVASCGSSGGGAGGAGPAPTSAAVQVFAANDLGMHCVDGDFSVLSILPPFNVVRAQVVRRTPDGRPELLGDLDVDLSYEAVADAAGSVNSTSLGDKTDFWEHAPALFGPGLAAGQGLTGLYMPADAPQPGPQPLAWEPGRGSFCAFGVPITPLDDAGAENPYPLLRIAARERFTGAVLARLDAVVPVSRETECRGCHATGGIAAQAPGVSWSDDPDLERQARWNVLIQHDLAQGTALVQAAPVLCAGCHYSKALDLAGAGPAGAQLGRPTLSRTMHAFHGALQDGLGQPLFLPDGSTLDTCYRCHPGRVTECQRGAMRTGGMVCFDCHGDMQDVGGADPLAQGGSLDGLNDFAPRRPWTDLPRCQSCHTGDAVEHLSGPTVVASADGIRLRQAWRVGDPAASPILASNPRFAENAGELYRDSTGHGGLACWACHGSTHAIWPNADPAANDNVAALQLQGHPGTIVECGACHAQPTGPTLGGPHGMHPVDASWVGEVHGSLYASDPAACRSCHGTALQGTVLSRAFATRSFHGEEGSVTIQAGTQVSCTLCHGAPGSGGGEGGDD